VHELSNQTIPTGSLVSVIVITRNSGRTIAACLKSIRSQIYYPIELIVIDNQSIDETPDIAGKYADVVDTFGPERSAQRNRGAELAGGDYLLFIDADMTLAPEVVGDSVEAIRSSGGPAVVIPEASFGEGFLSHCRVLERSCYEGDDDIESARFFRRRAFEESGGYDESLTGLEDRDLSLRIVGVNSAPRTNSKISHDEGKMRLREVLAKRRYYSASSAGYWRKHGRATLSQANVVFRPAFLRNWQRLVRHPMLAAGMFSLKSLEACASVVGLFEAWAGSRTLRETRSEM
jgi:glycosyltransferase involved in cell wall biosynthesis